MSHIYKFLYSSGIKNIYEILYKTFPESYSIQEKILKHEDNCQHAYPIIVEFCSSQEQTLMFHRFLKQLYHTFVESYNYQEYILLEKVIF